MLKNSLMFLVIILLTACQHPQDGIKRYPRLTLVLLKQLKCQGRLQGIFCSRSQCRYRRIYNN